MVDTKLFDAIEVFTPEEVERIKKLQRDRYYYPVDLKAMENRRRVLKHYRKYGISKNLSLYVGNKEITLVKMWNKFISAKGKKKTCFTSKNHNGQYGLYWVVVEELFKDLHTLGVNIRKTEMVIGKHTWYGIQVIIPNLTSNIDVLLTGLTEQAVFNDNYMFDIKENRDKIYDWVMKMMR